MMRVKAGASAPHIGLKGSKCPIENVGERFLRWLTRKVR